MGYLLGVVIWGIVGAVPGAIVGAFVYAAAWLLAYGDSTPVSPWWSWGPLAAGAVIGALRGLLQSSAPVRRTPEVDTNAWRLEEIRRNTEPGRPGD